jgi:hypothetical protein
VLYGYDGFGRLSQVAVNPLAASRACPRTQKKGPTAVVPIGARYYAYDEAGQLIGEYDANSSVEPKVVVAHL